MHGNTDSTSHLTHTYNINSRSVWIYMDVYVFMFGFVCVICVVPSVFSLFGCMYVIYVWVLNYQPGHGNTDHTSHPVHINTYIADKFAYTWMCRYVCMVGCMCIMCASTVSMSGTGRQTACYIARITHTDSVLYPTHMYHTYSSSLVDTYGHMYKCLIVFILYVWCSMCFVCSVVCILYVLVSTIIS